MVPPEEALRRMDAPAADDLVALLEAVQDLVDWYLATDSPVPRDLLSAIADAYLAFARDQRPELLLGARP